jgi:hypothetical protein
MVHRYRLPPTQSGEVKRKVHSATTTRSKAMNVPMVIM